MLQERLGYRPDIQGLRAVAILAVVLLHAGIPGVTGGYIGVDVFFVLSGYLIIGHLAAKAERGELSLAKFYAARIRRLLLPALVTIGATTALMAWLATPWDWARFKHDPFAALVGAMNYWLAASGQAYTDASLAPSPLRHFWSLGVEEQLYLAMPLLVLTLATLFARRAMAAVVVFLIVVTTASFALNVYEVATGSGYAYYGLLGRAWELTAGGLAAIWTTRLQASSALKRTAIGVAALGTIAACATLYGPTSMFPGALAAPVVAATVALLLVNHPVAGEVTLVGKLLGSAPMRFVGDHSYGWYLLHWPAVVIFAEMNPGLPDWAWLAGLSVAALVAAVAMRAALEVPFEKPALRNHAGWFPVGASGVAVVAVAVMLTGSAKEIKPAVAAPREDSSNTVAMSESQPEPIGDVLRRALEADTVTTAVTPPLAEAFGSWPDALHDGCHTDFDGVATPDEYAKKRTNPDCSYGPASEVATQRVLLIGDSHAGHWLPAFQAMPGVRVTNWTKAGCPVGVGSWYNKYRKGSYSECGKWWEGRLEAMKPGMFDLVVVSSDDHNDGGRAQDAEWADAVAQRLAAVKAQSETKVVFLLDTPSWEPWPTKCMLKKTLAADCAKSAADGYAHEGRRDAIRQAVLADGSASILDAEQFLCVDGECPATVNGIIAVRDQAHLTTEYARFISPWLNRELNGS